jgi:hypothetical protein
LEINHKKHKRKAQKAQTEEGIQETEWKKKEFRRQKTEDRMNEEGFYFVF